MELHSGILRATAPSDVEIEVAGVAIADRSPAWQKTGFYLDQMAHYESSRNTRRDGGCSIVSPTRAHSRSPARGPERGGHRRWKRAQKISRAAAANAQRNSVEVRWIEQDVFQFLRSAEKSEAQFDLIMLDPPSFTKTKGGLHDAMRGYNELHVRAFKLLSRDGMLATFSCSHHVSDGSLRQNDRRCAGRCAAFRAPAPPFRAGARSSRPAHLPETEYFRRSSGNDAGSIGVHFLCSFRCCQPKDALPRGRSRRSDSLR